MTMDHGICYTRTQLASSTRRVFTSMTLSIEGRGLPGRCALLHSYEVLGGALKQGVTRALLVVGA